MHAVSNTHPDAQERENTCLSLDQDEGLTVSTFCDSRTQLTRPLIFLFAVISGLSVATVYFAQPLLNSMAQSLNVQPAAIGIVVTLTQTGYALGLLFIVPMGDLLNRRTMIIGQISLSVIALIVVSLAPALSVLLLGMAVVGLMAVVVQVLVAYTATLALPEQRGRAIGTVTSGIVLGILFARFVSGALADLAGWRAVYFASSVVMLLIIGVLVKVLPKGPACNEKTAYFQLLASTGKLFMTVPLLRVRGVLALLIFAAFSVLWTAMVLPLSAAPFLLSHTEIGLFGLAGMAGALAAAKAGRWTDNGFGQKTTGIALALLALSWLPTAMMSVSLPLFIVGVVILDFAVQAVHVTNQSLIFAARPDAQSRLVGVYMTFYSVGSALGAMSATQVYALWGWHAVCILGAGFSVAAFIFWLLTQKTR